MHKFSKILSFATIAAVLFINALPAGAQLLPPPTPLPAPLPTPAPLPAPSPLPQVLPPPPADTTPPAISNILEASVLPTEATIAWSTDELAVSMLEYGTTPNYGSHATLDAGALLVHTGTILNLSPSTAYYYCIHATDLAGNTANSCGHTFQTAAAPVSRVLDTNPPAISLVTLASVATSSARVTWTTDEAANGEVEYGLTAGYGSVAGGDLDLSLAHSATISGLAANTIYHYRVRSSDQIGNVARSNDETFTTNAIGGGVVIAPPADMAPPAIANIIQEGIASYDATIVWTTNELATSRIRWGTTTNLGNTLALDASAGLAHAGTIANLAASTTYYYCIDATDIVGNTASSCGHSFMTAAAPVVADITPPVISVIAAAPVGTSTATVTWTTGELANAQVQYGTTTGYGSESALDANYTLVHGIPLAGLESSTTYHYRVKSSDQAGNFSISTDNTFTTGALPQTSVTVTNPEMTPNVTVGGISPNSITVSSVVFSSVETQSVGTSAATIIWHTDLPSDSQVEYGVSSQLGAMSALDAALTTSHSVTINSLQQDTNYMFRVVSRPAGVSVATVSMSHEFNTLAVPSLTSIPTNVSNVAATNVGASTATITWTTDKNATGRVFYGITTAYPQQSDLDLIMHASHSFTLANLTPSVLYHYRVQSIDETGNITYSDDHTFTTLSTGSGQALSTGSGQAAASIPAAPASVTVSVSEHDHLSATLAWNANSNNADVAEEYDFRYSTAPIMESNFADAAQDQATFVTYDDLAPNGTARAYVVAGLDPNTTYYFAVKAKYPAGAWSAISNVPSITTATVSPSVQSAQNENANSGSLGVASGAAGASGSVIGVSAFHVNVGGDMHAVSGPIAPPTTIIAAGEDGQIVFSWNDPDETSFVRTLVVKNAGGYPASPADGEVIYEGNGETFTDTSVSNGTTYYYAFYAYDRAKHYSRPVRVSLAPVVGKTEVVINGTPPISHGVDYHFTTVLAKGDTEPEVAHLQGMLVRYGFYPEKLVTSYFGPLTETALKRFQSIHGVPQTGVTDQKTQILLNAASLSDQTLAVPEDEALFENDLKAGATGKEVEALQQFLAYEGSYPEAQISGYFGRLTEKAAIVFQKKYHIIPAIGYIGPITRHTIETISGF